jgi:hypothetical protein
MGHASKGRIFVSAGDIRNMYTVLVGNQDTLQRIGRIFVSVGEIRNMCTIFVGNHRKASKGWKDFSSV